MAKTRRRRRRNPVANPVANRRRRRRNPVGFAANPRRRRRHARRNPPNGATMNIAGVRFPALNSIAFGTVGFLAPPMVEGYLSPYLPTQLTTTQWGRYVVKGGTVLGLSWLARTMAGHDAAYKIALGGGIYLAATLVNDFMPTVTGATVPRAAYYPRLAAQPLLGDYGRSSGGLTATTPARLQPQSRY